MTPKEQFLVSRLFDSILFDEIGKITGSNDAIIAAMRASGARLEAFYDEWQKSGLPLDDYCRLHG
jgi:hypothetical protein